MDPYQLYALQGIPIHYVPSVAIQSISPMLFQESQFPLAGEASFAFCPQYLSSEKTLIV